MSDIDPITGLPKELNAFDTIAKEGQHIIIRNERRKYGKKYTIVEGIDSSEFNIGDICRLLKNKLACGGAVKGKQIELQGDHAKKAKQILEENGFAPETIELQQS